MTTEENIEFVKKLLEKPPKKRKDCKNYVSGKCDLMYRIHGYGKPFNSRKYGWMWKCCDYFLGKPCENYKSRNKK